jgi:FAD/FMN-containing dehydrogenase
VPFLNLSHVTTYTYKQAVGFGEHRIMVRPRESFDLRILEATLRIDPEPSEVRWLHDVFGNSVAIASFDRQAKRLCFDSHTLLQHNPAELEHVDIEDYARTYPSTYSAEDMPDLLRSIERQHHDPMRQIDGWARRFIVRVRPAR